MFLRVNGLFGHVRRNDFRSIVAFLGFAVAIQILAATVLFVPLFLLDVDHHPLIGLTGYLWRYVPLVLLSTCGLFVWRYDRYLDALEDELGFGFPDAFGDQRLRRAVAEMATTAGVKVPRVAVVDSPALNAFACGTKPENSIVVATRGLLAALDDRELRAVVAHEITHIKNGDIRFMASAQVLFTILDGLNRVQWLRDSGKKGLGRGWLLVFTPAGALVMLLPILRKIGSFGSGLAMLIGRATRSGISLSREFIADAEAVRLSQDAGALVSALRKVEGRSRIEHLRPEFEAMMIDGSAKGASPTHPPIRDRIAALLRLAGPMAAEPYTSQPALAGVPAGGFGRKRAASPFLAVPAPAFAGPEPEAITRSGDEQFVVDFLKGRAKRVPTTSEKWIGGTVALAFVAVSLPIMWSGAMSQSTQVGAIGTQPSDADTARATGCFPEYVQIGSPEPYYSVSRRPDLVAAYRSGDRTSQGATIEFERYVAWHERSLSDLHYAGDNADTELVEYVRKRKMNLEQAHDLFGPAGYAAMRADYQSAEDGKAVDRLAARLRDPKPLPLADEVTVADLRSLVAQPQNFLPCRAVKA